LQNDWAQYRTQVNGRMQEVHFAVNTLGYSRRFHFVAMACEDAFLLVCFGVDPVSWSVFGRGARRSRCRRHITHTRRSIGGGWSN
jgi:hypothetical protein